ncbi:electron transport complex subunit RsxG [Kineobactrum sediminis]|uniref:Ion-translocating oxidoreductase complex subunit G n=1 Tax=Kineobactrum sediminis TaxID=1905677 RepID=A0A2N5Y0Z8_9GAMM|nr:electron transport complex subunit RsxG [Kineobactrum sediminis]PLW82061.1 electron transport complex subunit RsxG [Kineobactrum sediminis]
MLGQSITRNSALLALFALVTALLITGTYLLTRDTIAQERRQAEQRALLEVVPRERHDNSMLDDTLPLPADTPGLGLREDRQLYIARQGDKAVAVIVPVLVRDGYSGDIELIVGVNRDGSIAGVRALNHRETPGLGDKIDLRKSDWILDFNGRSLDSPPPQRWGVKKDGGVFDQFTGATITPRAVVAGVLRALLFVESHRAIVFATPADKPATGDQA